MRTRDRMNERLFKHTGKADRADQARHRARLYFHERDGPRVRKSSLTCSFRSRPSSSQNGPRVVKHMVLGSSNQEAHVERGRGERQGPQRKAGGVCEAGGSRPCCGMEVGIDFRPDGTAPATWRAISEFESRPLSKPNQAHPEHKGSGPLILEARTKRRLVSTTRDERCSPYPLRGGCKFSR